MCTDGDVCSSGDEGYFCSSKSPFINIQIQFCKPHQPPYGHTSQVYVMRWNEWPRTHELGLSLACTIFFNTPHAVYCSSASGYPVAHLDVINILHNISTHNTRAFAYSRSNWPSSSCAMVVPLRTPLLCLGALTPLAGDIPYCRSTPIHTLRRASPIPLLQK